MADAGRAAEGTVAAETIPQRLACTADGGTIALMDSGVADCLYIRDVFRLADGGH